MNPRGAAAFIRQDDTDEAAAEEGDNIVSINARRLAQSLHKSS